MGGEGIPFRPHLRWTVSHCFKEFWAGFAVRGLVVSKKNSAASRRVFVVFKNFPRLRRGFIVVQRSVCLLQNFTVFALKKLKIFPPLRVGVLLFKNFPPLRGGVLLFPGFSEKLTPGICNGRVNVISPVVTLLCIGSPPPTPTYCYYP